MHRIIVGKMAYNIAAYIIQRLSNVEVKPWSHVLEEIQKRGIRALQCLLWVVVMVGSIGRFLNL